jgi:hypothetical protein
MQQFEEWIARVAFSCKGRHPTLLSHLNVVLPPPATCLCSVVSGGIAIVPVEQDGV